MRTRKYLETMLCAGLLMSYGLSLGCAKGSARDAKAPAPPEVTTTAAAEGMEPVLTEENSDSITRVSFKTAVPRDKVEQILDIYARLSKTMDSGREIYNIALLASRQTGVSTEDVGSVILSYRSLVESSTIPGPRPAKEATRG